MMNLQLTNVKPIGGRNLPPEFFGTRSILPGTGEEAVSVPIDAALGRRLFFVKTAAQALSVRQ